MNRLLSRLENIRKLSEAEKITLRASVTSHRRHLSDQVSITGTNPADGLTVILEGFACRYKLLGIGRRQILGYLLPGDICGLRASALARAQCCIGTFGPTETAILVPERILNAPDRYPNLARALWCSMLAEESVAREWITNVGQRTAYERVAHFFCEMFVRLQQVGLTENDRAVLPLTQRDLADALSLSAVHVNRVLRQLRLDGLLTFRRGELFWQNLPALRDAAGFDSAYLHLHPGF